MEFAKAAQLALNLQMTGFRVKRVHQEDLAVTGHRATSVNLVQLLTQKLALTLVSCVALVRLARRVSAAILAQNGKNPAVTERHVSAWQIPTTNKSLALLHATD